MINLREKNINQILKGFNNMTHNFLDIGTYKLDKDYVDFNIKDVIKNCSKARHQINVMRGVTNNKKFRRLGKNEVCKYYQESKQEKIINLMSMTTEILLNDILFNCNNDDRVFLILPNPVEYKLNGQVDYKICDISFDLKSQFSSEKYFNINERVLETKMKKNKFCVLGLINGDKENFDTWNEVTFFYINLEYFKNNSTYKKIDDREGYFSMDMYNLIQGDKND